MIIIERKCKTEDASGNGLQAMLESVGSKVGEVHRVKESRLDGANAADKVQKFIDKLESLKGIVSTIDQLAEVTQHCFCIRIVLTRRQQMHSAVKLAWSISSSLFKVGSPSVRFDEIP